MGSTSYRVEPNVGGNGFDVVFTNPVTGAEVIVWGRVNEKRAEDLARGSNLMMDQVLGAAARAYQDSVRAFHAKFGHAQPDQLELPTPDALRFRAGLIREEAKEAGKELDALADLLERTKTPIGHREVEAGVAKCLGEMADSLYVGFGGFVIFGIAAWPIFEELQRANMSKIPNPNGGKPLKPEGWTPPRIKEMIFGDPE